MRQVSVFMGVLGGVVSRSPANASLDSIGPKVSIRLLDEGNFHTSRRTNPVPFGYLLGMQRTVTDQNCSPNCQTWVQSEAYGNDPFPFFILCLEH